MTFRTVLIPSIILILHRRIIFYMVPWILKLLLLTIKISPSRIGNYFSENCAWPVFSRSIVPFVGSYRNCERKIYNPGNLRFGLLISLVSKSLHRKASSAINFSEKHHLQIQSGIVLPRRARNILTKEQISTITALQSWRISSSSRFSG